MGTSCYIGVVHDDGTVSAVRCTHDSYPSGVGETLLNHYQAKEKAEKLVNLNDFSVLENTVEMTRVTEYGDGGESTTYASEAEFLDEFHDSSFERYAYLLKDGLWYVAGTTEDKQLIPLTRQLINENE